MRQAWLINPAFDVILAFGAFAFYAWLSTTPLVGDVKAHEWRHALDVATTIAFGVNFVHRHFVYLLFFGDPDKRARHPRAVWFLPAAAIVVVVAKLAPGRSAFDALLWTLAAWNVWHTLMQRHGIFRAYAAKSRSSTSGRLDLALLWSIALATTGAVIAFDQDTFAVAAVRAWHAIPYLPEHRDAQLAFFGVTCAVLVVVAALWLKSELRVPSASRFVFLASTCALFAVFVVHGPVVGFIVFSVAHALEYVLFVYAYTKKRATNEGSPRAIQLLGRALPLAALSVVLIAIFAALQPVWTTSVVVVAYTATSVLHYLYDGVIWKMRRPEVRAPIAPV